MDFKAQELLREIGSDLDHHEFPCVYDGGVVMPSETTSLPSTLGREKNNVSPRQRRPAAGSWQGPTRRQGPPRKTAPVICAGLQKQYEAELDAVQEAYPGTKSWHQIEGLWLLTESTILNGLGKKATFLTAIPYTLTSTARSWGYWTTALSAQWIGPRHTNFPDGSICAFEPRDKTWVIGDTLIKLLDLYSVWALRHLHLEKLRRWPGYQSVPHPFERLWELRDDEFCGCGNSDKLYIDCCKKQDLAKDGKADLIYFLRWANGGSRKPPEDILNFINRRKEPPPIIALLS